MGLCRRIRRNALLGLALTLLVVTPALAQGRVTGTVKDTDDRPVRGATITAENPNAAPSTVTATTDAKGRFAFLGLRSGRWAFRVRAPGFQTAIAEAMTRTLGSNAPLLFVLSPIPELPPLGPVATIDVPAFQTRLDEAAALDAAGKVDDAIQRYRELSAQLPALTTIHLQLGLLYERKHDTAAAAAEYQMVLKTDPGNAKARAALDRLARE